MSDIFLLSKEILFGENNISMYLITLIAGLFGFIIASIPLTIQLLEIKDNDNIDKINSNPVMKKKIFERYIKLIKASFYLCGFILILEFINISSLSNTYIYICLTIFYMILIFYFFKQLYKLINILKELILIYIK